MRSTDRTGWRALAIVVFMACAVVSYLGFVPMPVVEVGWRDSVSSGDNYGAGARVDTGPELTFVFITSSTCGPSNDPALPAVIEELKLLLQGHAASVGRGFAAVGIAKDSRVEAGLRHLKKFGVFDEVTTGRGWLNMGVLDYVYEQTPGPAATPQVLVLEGFVDVENGERAIHIGSALVRKVGLVEIQAWNTLGAPIPRLGTTDESGDTGF